MSHLLPAFGVFASGCLLIHLGRPYARATTVLLSATALMLSVTVGGTLCQRIGLADMSSVMAMPSVGRPGQ